MLEFLSLKSLRATALRSAKAFLEQLPITYIPINRSILIKAAEMRRVTHLKTPDAIHMATAFELKAQLVLTSDRDFLKWKHIKVEII